MEPRWATPEVAAGGFATDKLAASGALRAHERALLDSLGLAHDAGARGALNAHYLTDAGLAELASRLRDGTYRIEVPEEAALLVVAWLREQGAHDQVAAVVAAIAPALGALRFYPVPHPDPEPDDDRVHLQPAGVTARQLDALRDRERFLAEREAIQVWAPLVDRLAELVTETVEDGWPCQVFPDGWKERALAAVLAVTARQLAPHRCRDVDRPRSNLARLAALVERAAHDPLGLGGHEVGELRGILARIELRRGQPGSPRLLALRATQAARVARPTLRDQAREAAARLHALPAERGVDATEVIRAPEAVRAIVRRSLDARPEALVDAGVIASPQALARVAPQRTAGAAGADVRDPDLRRLHAAVTRAFRRHRALVLPWLAPATRLDDLPWLAAMPRAGGDDGYATRVALRGVIELALLRWPHRVVPEALRRAVVPDLDDAGVQRVARRLDGTLYATYFGATCTALASRAERREIATTQYLVPIVGAIGMTPRLAAALPQLARTCFTETLRALARHATKDAARAWRQMIAWLSLAPRGTLDAYLMWAGQKVAELPDDARLRFGPAFAGLCLAAAGMTPSSATAPAATPLLGSSNAAHARARR